MRVRPFAKRDRTDRRPVRGRSSGVRAGRPVPVRPRRGSLLAEVAMATVMLMIGDDARRSRSWATRPSSAERRTRGSGPSRRSRTRWNASPPIRSKKSRPSAAAALSISPGGLQSLPGAELTVAVDESQPGAGRSAKRIAVRLRWRNRVGEWEAPVRLATWIERAEAGPMMIVKTPPGPGREVPGRERSDEPTTTAATRHHAHRGHRRHERRRRRAGSLRRHDSAPAAGSTAMVMLG